MHLLDLSLSKPDPSNGLKPGRSNVLPDKILLCCPLEDKRCSSELLEAQTQKLGSHISLNGGDGVHLLLESHAEAEVTEGPLESNDGQVGLGSVRKGLECFQSCLTLGL